MAGRGEKQVRHQHGNDEKDIDAAQESQAEVERPILATRNRRAEHATQPVGSWYCRHQFFSFCRTPGKGGAALGLAAPKSSPSRWAMVAAIWLCVVSTFSRTPKDGESGPRTPIQMNSAVGTSLP